jgi:hypothetical protein
VTVDDARGIRNGPDQREWSIAFPGPELAEAIKDELLLFLIEQKRLGKRVAAYGAAAKGNTLLNYAGIRADLLPAVADRAASKQGKFLPGSHIPVISPEQLNLLDPDVVLVLPWNLIEELTVQLKKYIILSADTIPTQANKPFSQATK